MEGGVYSCQGQGDQISMVQTGHIAWRYLYWIILMRCTLQLLNDHVNTVGGFLRALNEIRTD